MAWVVDGFKTKYRTRIEAEDWARRVARDNPVLYRGKEPIVRPATDHTNTWSRGQFRLTRRSRRPRYRGR